MARQIGFLGGNSGIGNPFTGGGSVSLVSGNGITVGGGSVTLNDNRSQNAETVGSLTLAGGTNSNLITGNAYGLLASPGLQIDDALPVTPSLQNYTLKVTAKKTSNMLFLQSGTSSGFFIRGYNSGGAGVWNIDTNGSYVQPGGTLTYTGVLTIKTSVNVDAINTKAGATSISLTSSELIDGSITAVNWYYRILSDSSGQPAMNFNTRVLIDSGGGSVIDFSSGVCMAGLPTSDPANGRSQLWMDPATRQVKVGT